MRFAMLTGAALLVATVAACVVPNPAVVRTTSKGPALTDVNQMTMYTFDKDAPDKSNCNGQCAVAWPPLKAYSSDAGAGDWSVVARDDGTHQWAYKGKPLYGWFKDKAPGDATGDGFRGVWHIATP
jgi:predicted lipoprotein with Yx(FWY)xxD motif